MGDITQTTAFDKIQSILLDHFTSEYEIYNWNGLYNIVYENLEEFFNNIDDKIRHFIVNGM